MGVKEGFGEDIFDPSPGQVSGPLVRFLDHVYKTAFADIFFVISVHGISIFYGNGQAIQVPCVTITVT
jgi:hypothetical protein